ncbi:MAG TPA: ADP/ATP-dependent (S)-NAD(P)H-hydrate dehydratase, partial [Blastocatellia bacterium]|nr:ADP/ATP-dependent (S)-NAD(P)H-hydrate dehydratase [Blastocatellia bacterium]
MALTDRVVRGWSLPQPLEEGDKEERGRVLVIGGAPEMPGAAVLAATAALRAGAGKVRIATCRSIAPFVGIAVPEARVFALPETRRGGIGLSGSAELAKQAGQVDAALIGPGLVDKAGVNRLMSRLIPLLKEPLVVLDAEALSFLRQEPRGLHGLGGRAILTPHAGEMANILKVDKEEIERAPSAFAKQAAELFGAVVVLKGAETYIATPEGAVYLNKSGNVGLATS